MLCGLIEEMRWNFKRHGVTPNFGPIASHNPWSRNPPSPFCLFSPLAFFAPSRTFPPPLPVPRVCNVVWWLCVCFASCVCDHVCVPCVHALPVHTLTHTPCPCPLSALPPPYLCLVRHGVSRPASLAHACPSLPASHRTAHTSKRGTTSTAHPPHGKRPIASGTPTQPATPFT